MKQAIYVGFVAAVYLVLIVGRLATHRGNSSAFAEIGSDFADTTSLPAGYVVRQGAGADGQFYLRLSLDPLSSAITDHGISLDNPPYRQQRIIFPALAWLFTLSNPAVVPSALIAINYLAICALAWIGLELALCLGRSAGWGLFLPLYPGFVVSLARDLGEIVAICFVAGALLALLHRRHITATLLLALAALTRETTALIPLCLVLAATPWKPKRVTRCTPPLVVGLAPIIVLAVWEVFLWTRWGVVPLAAGDQNLAQPLSGLLGFIASVGAWPFSELGWHRLTEVLLGAAMTLAVSVTLRSSSIGLPVKIAWAGYGMVALTLSSAVWQSDWHIMRGLSEWYLLGLLILLGVSSRAARLPLLGALPVWVWTAQQAFVG